MKKNITLCTPLTLRSLVNKLRHTCLTVSAAKTFGLLLIIVFGLTQFPVNSAAVKAAATPKVRLTFNTSYLAYVNQDNGFQLPPSGIGTTSGKCIRIQNEGKTAFAWEFPETIGPEGATFRIGVSGRANEKGRVYATITSFNNPVKETTKSGDVSIEAKPGEALQRHEETFTLVPQSSYERHYVEFAVRCQGGFDVIFRYNIEQ